MGEVHVKIFDQDWVHPVREIPEHCHGEIDIAHYGWRYIAPNHMAVIPPCNQLEAEEVQA